MRTPETLTGELADALEHMSDAPMAHLAWIVIRALADRGADLRREIAELIETEQGGQRWQLDEAVAQLEDI